MCLCVCVCVCVWCYLLGGTGVRSSIFACIPPMSCQLARARVCEGMSLVADVRQPQPCLFLFRGKGK